MNWLKSHWQLLTIIAVVFGLWATPVVLPLKILIVFFHELAHAGTAVLTGGSIVEISVSAEQGGLALTRGGSRFLILFAGYLGSLLTGVLLLILALRTQADRAVMAICGALMLLVTAFYIRDVFPVVFCAVTGAAMLAAARFLSTEINDIALRVIGLTSMIYVPYDIFDDTIARSNLRSDARMLAEEFGGTTMMWGGLWLGISFAVIFFSLRYALGQTSNIPFKRQQLP